MSQESHQKESVIKGAGKSKVMPAIKPKLLKWEKIRVVYNLVVGAFVLVGTWLLHPGLLNSTTYWITLVEGALVANVCFFAGPLAEIYFAWLGARKSWITTVIAVCGILLTLVLAFLVFASFSFGDVLPDQN